MLHLAAAVETRRRTPLLRVDTLENREAPSSVALGWEWFAEAPASPTATYSSVVNLEPASDSVDTTTRTTVVDDPAQAVQLPATPSDSGSASISTPDAEQAEIRVGRDGGPRRLSGGPSNAPPVISNFVHVMGAGGLCTFTGQVTDETPGNLTIRFGGAPDSLQGITATTNSTGAFTKTVQLQLDGTDVGTAEVQTTDPQGLDSNVAYRYVSP